MGIRDRCGSAGRIPQYAFRRESASSGDVYKRQPWCGPCRGLAPVIDEIAQEYAGRANVYKMNVDDSPMTPGRFGIRAIPTLIVFKNGEIVEQVTGAVGKSNITAMLDKALA